jgi:hypothetical protein
MNPGWIFYLISGICAAGELMSDRAIGMQTGSWGLPVGAAVVGLLFFMGDFKRPHRKREMWMGIIVGTVGVLLPWLA